MEHSPLATLPVELRIAIYEHVSTELVVNLTDRLTAAQKKRCENLDAITRVCREIRLEIQDLLPFSGRVVLQTCPDQSTPLWYESLTSQSSTPKDPTTSLMEKTKRWLKCFQPNSKRIGKVTVDLGTIDVSQSSNRFKLRRPKPMTMVNMQRQLVSKAMDSALDLRVTFKTWKETISGRTYDCWTAQAAAERTSWQEMIKKSRDAVKLLQATRATDKITIEEYRVAVAREYERRRDIENFIADFFESN